MRQWYRRGRVSEVEDLSGRTLGDFVLRARIGEGGFGAVYRCDQPGLGRQAVVKVLHPRLRSNNMVLQRFMREAQLASQLDHPGAAHIYAFGIEHDDGLFWIAMEMVQGTALDRWLRERGPITLDQFVPLFEQLADVVHAAHERGIVHRDLKPSNVMVIERGGRLVPKLLDFGVAKLLEGAEALRSAPVTSLPHAAAVADAIAVASELDQPRGSPGVVTQTASAPVLALHDRRRLTHIESTVGSPPYMSPEQWTNAVDVTPASDLYALAVVAYEAITGRRPFAAASLSEYADLHCDAPVPPVGEGLPSGLDRFFERALAKRPKQRWASAIELAAALRAEWIASRVAGEPSAVTRSVEAARVGAAGGDDEAAPYQGLAAYAIGDASRYVGREAEVAELLARLRSRPLQVVVGPPGAGKSSFVHAGVVPGLPPGWRTVALRPGAAPLAALAFRLEQAGVAGEDLRGLLATSPVAAAARVADAAASGGAIVVVIDQLEELFTLGASADECDQFAAAIAQLAASADLPVRVIATIRDDFLMRLDALAALRPLLSPALVLLGNPLHDDLVRILVEPARRAGYTLSDPRLAHDMVSAVARRPGALAILSFTALRLWELRDPTVRQLTRAAYDAMDGVAGALVRHAEATFDGLAADEQRLAREIFRHLVTADGARAPLSLPELQQRLAAPRGDAVLDKLIAARLIATSEATGGAGAGTQVEVIHDALLEAWPRLRRWILLPGSQVVAIAFDPTGAQIVAGSRGGDVSIWTVATGARSRQLSTAGSTWSVIAWSPDGRSIAARGRTVTQMWNAVTGDLQFELPSHDADAYQVEFDPTSRYLLSAARDGSVLVADVVQRTTVSVLQGPRASVRAAHFDPTGRQVIAASTDGAAWLWNAAPQYLVTATPAVAEHCGTVVGERAARRFVALDCGAEGVQVWDTSGPRHVTDLPPMPPSSSPSGSIVSADGGRAAVVHDHDVHVYELPAGRLVRRLSHAAEVSAMAFAPDGHALLIGLTTGALWLAREGADPELLAQIGAEIDIVDWLPDGRALVADATPRLRAFEIRTRTLVGQVALSPPMRYSAFRTSEDGRRTLLFLMNTMVGPLPLLDLVNYRLVAQLDPQRSDVYAARFFNGDRRIVVATHDGTTRIWDAETGALHGTYQEPSTWLTEAAINPAGTMLVTGGGDGVLRFWDLASGRKLWNLEMRFDGADLVTRGFEGEFARWHIPPPPSPAEFARGLERVLACLPAKFDERTGNLADQTQRCEF